MSVRVRVKNFQSIKDVEVLVDGFAVITGPNNSGKTALMRAIKGVFTNASPGPLTRYGEAFLSVELTFGDGRSVLWEKGWEKPDQKGKVVNRYTIDGVLINSVGKGPPPELDILGVSQVSASTERVWPQIADQFDGVLFLVNRPPSAIAEALSDVERVGRLSNALKLSDKDRRSTFAELEIRRKDLKSIREEVKFFLGLDEVAAKMKDLEVLARDTVSQEAGLSQSRNLLASWTESSSRAKTFDGFGPVGQGIKGLEALQQDATARRVPLVEARGLRTQLDRARRDSSQYQGFVPLPPSIREVEGVAQQQSADLKTARRLLVSLGSARRSARSFEGFALGTPPDSSRAQKLAEALRITREFIARRDSVRKELKRLKGLSLPELPDASAATRARSALAEAQRLQEKLAEARAEVGRVVAQESAAQTALASVEDSVQKLLGDRGICPTCKSIHSGASHVG